MLFIPVIELVFDIKPIYLDALACRSERIQGALNTHSEVDWQVVAFVHGWSLSQLGIRASKKFETAWQHYPTVGLRTLEESIRIGRYLIHAERHADYHLFIESEI